jgi:hypothetical protein
VIFYNSSAVTHDRGIGSRVYVMLELSYLAMTCGLLGPGDWSLKSDVEPHFRAPDMDRFDIELDRFRGDVAVPGAPCPAGDMGIWVKCYSFNFFRQNI